MIGLHLQRAAGRFGVTYRARVRCAKIFDGRLRDKSGSPPASQVIDMTCLLPCRSVGARAATSDSASVINVVFGTIAHFATQGSSS